MKKTSTQKKSTAKKEVKENTFPVVAIGASAGGLEAMMELLKHLPSETGMAYIYVQHLSPDHKSMLTEILSKKTKMKVQEIDDMDKIKPDNLFVIPHNKGIEVTDGHIKLIPRSETSVAISIDILFSSLAEAQKERVIGIVLSGSASDGTVGIKAIKQQGGLTFAQDDTAKFVSMPRSAIATGMVDFILSPENIALELARLSKHPLIKTVGVKNGEEDLIDNSNPDLKAILNQLHKATGVDFNAYKMNTIKRRIIRRMLLYKIKTLKEYTKLLTQKNEETDILYQDLLINVTSFFRDTDTHKYLKESLFPKLLKQKKPGESLRIWVAACATGEEAYSIAMMLLEIQGSQTTSIPVQIFATDLSQQAIGKARIGVYTKHDLETVSPKRIQRFFIKDNGNFRVNKAVRDLCVFAPHNILRDPPFSRLDFVSCCNLFIYFDTAAQKKAVNTFHYALNDGGFLMLGKAENISQSPNLFTSSNKKFKIFSRKINSGTRTTPELSPRLGQQTLAEKNVLITNKNKPHKHISVNHNGLDNAIDEVLLSEFMPASVVINHQMEIVQFRGTTDLYLTHPKGKATFNILKMARPEIAFELRNAISKVIKTKHRFRKSGIEIKINSAIRMISVEIVPLKIEADEPLLLILFTEQEQTEIYSQQAKGGKNNSLAKDRRIKKLEQELASAHAEALSISQEQEAFTEELQSSNEEVVSSNEELQTVNEELETSKEEIESANEELITTNQELQTRNDLLSESYEYAEAVTATIHEAMIVLDKNLRIKSANKSFYKIFKVKEEETEGMFLFELGNKQWNIPSLREFLQEIVPKNSHFHDFEVSHNFPQIGEKVMLLNASRVIQKRHGEELILLSINDVTEVRKKAQELLAVEHKYLSRFQHLLLQTPVAIAIYRGSNYIAELVNDLALEILNKDKNLIGKPLFQSMPELESQLKPAFDNVMQSGIPFHANEFEATLLRNGKNEKTYFNTIFEPIREDDNTISGVIVVAIEVTDQVIARKKIEESDKRYNMMLMNSPFTFAVLKGKDLVIALANDRVKEVWGKGNDIEGKSLLAIMPELNDTPFPALLAEVRSTGIPYHGREVQSPKNLHGHAREEYFNFVFQPYMEADQTISGITIIGNDVTEQVIAKRKIEESDKRYNMMVMQSPFAFAVLKGKDMVVTLANDSIKEMWGKGNQIENKPLVEVLPEIKGQGFMELLDGVYTTGIPHAANEILAQLKRHGKMEDVYFNFVYQPYREADETISGVAIIAHEVTTEAITKRKIEESETKFKQLAELMPQKIWTADATGNKIYFNKTLLDYAGMSLEELKGEGWKKLIHPDDWEQYENKWEESLATAKKCQSESRILRKDGKYLWHLTMAVPLKDEQGNIILWIGSKTEIQEQRKQKEILEEAVSNRTAELMQANEELLKMNKELEAFTFVSSHDLQEPLRKIQTLAGRILEKENQNLSDYGKNYFRLMQNSAERMRQLIQDLLAFSRISVAERKFEITDLNIIIEEVKSELKESIEEKRAVIEVKEICEVHIIPFQFRQLLHNLISNALKFSNPKIPPHITIESRNIKYSKENIANLPAQKEYYHISITDNGIGFEKEFSTKIFEVFQRLHDREKYTGTGIGLAIVKKIVDNHNGTITATGELNKGATFDIYIPASLKQ